MAIPSTSVGVATASSLACMATLALLLDLGDVPMVPDYLAFDPYSLLTTDSARRRVVRVGPAAARIDPDAERSGISVGEHRDTITDQA